MKSSWWVNKNFSWEECLEYWEKVCSTKLKDYSEGRGKIRIKFFLMECLNLKSKQLITEFDMLPAKKALIKAGWRRTFSSEYVSYGGEQYRGKVWHIPRNLKRWSFMCDSYYSIKSQASRYIKDKNRVDIKKMLKFLMCNDANKWKDASEEILKNAGFVRNWNGWYRKKPLP